MTRNESRMAGGLQMKAQDAPVLYGPVRDAGAPSDPMMLDSSAGLMQADDSPRSLQWGEGMEEVVWYDGDQLFLPAVVATEPEQGRIITEFNAAAQADGNDLEPVDATDVAFYPAEITVPQGLDVLRFKDYRTGYTEQPPLDDDDIHSIELLNYLEVDVPDAAEPVDLEHMPDDDGGVIHFDRPVYAVNVATGDVTMYRGGDAVYSGDVAGMIDYFEDGFGWDDVPTTPATVKFQDAVRYGPAEGEQPWDVDEQVAQYLLD